MSARLRTGVVAGAVLALFALGIGIFLLPFAYPTPPPIVTRFQSTRLFSPNEDQSREVARVSVRLRQPSQVTLTVRGPEREVVRRLLVDQPHRRGWLRVSWAGKDEAGLRVPDGTYALDLNARSGRKRWNSSRRILVDTISPGISELAVASSALTGREGAECQLRLRSRESGQLTLEAIGAGRAVRRLGPRPIEGGERLRWSWDGRGDGGRAVPVGLYTLRATVTDIPGNRQTRTRTCWVGHLLGSVVPSGPRPGDRVRVRLRTPDGVAVEPSTPVALAIYRRTATPGRDGASPLGTRIGARTQGRAARVSIVLPRRKRPSAFWVVANSRGRRALIPIPSP
jgi:FlgD Ig-like domain